MEKCYTVMLYLFDIDTKDFKVSLLRVYKDLDKAVQFVSDTTGFCKNDILDAFNEGEINIQLHYLTYLIQENVLE